VRQAVDKVRKDKGGSYQAWLLKRRTKTTRMETMGKKGAHI